MSDKMMRELEPYNGWSSYETWRMMDDYFNQMEMEELDDIFFYNMETNDIVEVVPGTFSLNVDYRKLHDDVKFFCESKLEEKNEMYVVESFLENVDWEELVNAIVDNFKEMLEYA